MITNGAGFGAVTVPLAHIAPHPLNWTVVQHCVGRQQWAAVRLPAATCHTGSLPAPEIFGAVHEYDQLL